MCWCLCCITLLFIVWHDYDSMHSRRFEQLGESERVAATTKVKRELVTNHISSGQMRWKSNSEWARETAIADMCGCIRSHRRAASRIVIVIFLVNYCVLTHMVLIFLQLSHSTCRCAVCCIISLFIVRCVSRSQWRSDAANRMFPCNLLIVSMNIFKKNFHCHLANLFWTVPTALAGFGLTCCADRLMHWLCLSKWFICLAICWRFDPILNVHVSACRRFGCN